MPDTLIDPTEPRYAAALAERKRRRTPAQRKADYSERQVERALEQADEGPTSYPATYWQPSEYTAYGERVAEDAAIEAEAAWDRAVAMWNATPGDEDGEARYEAMTAAFGNDDTLWQEMHEMFTELGGVA